MKKIPTLFQRDMPERGPRYVRDEVTPGCEWVLAGEGVATRKLDGACVLIRRDGLAVHAFARREVRPGTIPPNPFIEIEHDATTGKTVGWEPAEKSAFAKIIAEVLARPGAETLEAGTYELLGPKVNGNPEGEVEHMLRAHGRIRFADTGIPGAVYAPPPLTFDGLREFLLARPFEGIVWHHPDGRMAKLKRRDFPKEG